MKKLTLLLALVAGLAHAQTFNLFKPANGILKGQTTTYITTAAAAGDVFALWSGTCDATHFLRGDGACAVPAGTSTGTVTSVALTVPTFLSISGSPITTSGTLAVTLSGTALPVANGGTGATTLTGPIKGSGTSALSPAASADIYGLWSGSCSSSTYLRGDGSCATPTGSGGTVTSVALTVPGILSISGSPVTTSGTLAIGATGTSGGIPYFSSSTGLASSGVLTANELVLGGGAGGTPTVVASLGTTTTLLHGNASGAPTFSAVSLSADVTGTLAASSLPSNTKVRSFGTTFGDTGGSALTSGSVVYFTIPYTCTISAWNATVDAGTVTFDIWKIATGTAIPTVTNTITASALPAISTGTALHSTTLTGWTTSVSANDIVGIQLKTVATAKYAELDVECDQ